MPGRTEPLLWAALVAGGGLLATPPAHTQPVDAAPLAAASMAAGRFDDAHSALGTEGFVDLARQSPMGGEAAGWLQARWPREPGSAGAAARFVAERGSLPDALGFLEDLLGRHPGDSRVAAALAAVQLVAGRDGGPAVQAALAGARDAAERFEAGRRQADLLAWRGESEEARTVLDALEAPLAARSEVRYQAGVLALRVGDLDGAGDRFAACVDDWIAAAEAGEASRLPHPEGALATLRCLVGGRPLRPVAGDVVGRVLALRERQPLLMPGMGWSRMVHRLWFADPGDDVLEATARAGRMLDGPGPRCPDYALYSRDLMRAGLHEVRAQAWLGRGERVAAAGELRAKRRIFPRLPEEEWRLG